MTDRRTDDLQSEQIEDLPSEAVDSRNAEQVKGGFNPQPDPPLIGAPVYRPPVYNPAPGLRL